MYSCKLTYSSKKSKNELAAIKSAGYDETFGCILLDDAITKSEINEFSSDSTVAFPACLTYNHEYHYIILDIM